MGDYIYTQWLYGEAEDDLVYACTLEIPPVLLF